MRCVSQTNSPSSGHSLSCHPGSQTSPRLARDHELRHKLVYDRSTDDLENDARRTALEGSTAPEYRQRSTIKKAGEEVNRNGERQDHRSRVGFNLHFS